MKMNVIEWMLSLCLSMGIMCQAQENPFVFSPNQYDIQNKRIVDWDENYRTSSVSTPEELPDFLVPVKELYYKEVEKYCARNGDALSGCAEELIEKTFELQARYYYLQLKFGELCYGPDDSEALQQYKVAIERNAVRLSLQILNECVWCGDDDELRDEPSDLQKRIAAMPAYENWGPVDIFRDYAQAKMDVSVNMVQLYTYANIADNLRSSRLFELVNIAADVNYYACDNTLAGNRWPDQEVGNRAASLIIQQFDACRAIMFHAVEYGLFVPKALSFTVGNRHEPNLLYFYEHQEDFLLRILNYRNVNPAAEPAQPAQSAPVAAPSVEKDQIELWVNPVCSVFTLLLGLLLGWYLKGRQLR